MLDLLYNLMLESTGRLQKCRIYEMTDNKTARSTIAYLIVRDQAHENAFAKALESLGVNWGSVLPIPKTNAERFPEVKKLLDKGLQSIQYTFSADNASRRREAVPRSLTLQRRHRAQHRADARRRAHHDRSGTARRVLPRSRQGVAGLDPGDSRSRDQSHRGPGRLLTSRLSAN